MSQTPDRTEQIAAEMRQAMTDDPRGGHDIAIGRIRAYVDPDTSLSDAERLEHIRQTLAALDLVAGQWRPANEGAGKMRWYLIRETPSQRAEYYDGADGRLVRYGSYESARKVADRLNSAQLGEPTKRDPAAGERDPGRRAAWDMIRRTDGLGDDGGDQR